MCVWVEKCMTPPAQTSAQVNALALDGNDNEEQEHAPSLRVPDFKPFVGYIEVDTLEHIQKDEDSYAVSEPASSEDGEALQDTIAYDALPLDTMSAKRARIEDAEDVQQTHPPKY